MKKLLFLIAAISIALCSACQSPQEEEGVSPLPQNRPTKSEMKMGTGFPIKY